MRRVLPGVAAVALLAGTAYLALAHEAAGAFGDAAGIVIPTERVSADFNINGLPSPADSDWMNSLEDGLKPFGDGVGGAQGAEAADARSAADLERRAHDQRVEDARSAERAEAISSTRAGFASR